MLVDIFRPVPPEARRENLAAYRRFLADRDGVMDIEKRQLSRREQGMLRYERPLSRIRDIDRELFAAQYDSFNPKVETPPELLLLLALLKINGAEAFGVERNYEKVFRRAMKNEDQCELTLLIEETYHTRILLSTALSYGVEVKSAYKPPVALRTLISTIAMSPTFIARPLTLAAEVLAVLLFLNLLEKSRVVLRHDPELRDAVEERLCGDHHRRDRPHELQPLLYRHGRHVAGPRASPSRRDGHVRSLSGAQRAGDHVVGDGRRSRVPRFGQATPRAGGEVRFHIMSPRPIVWARFSSGCLKRAARGRIMATWTSHVGSRCVAATCAGSQRARSAWTASSWWSSPARPTSHARAR